MPTTTKMMDRAARRARPGLTTERGRGGVGMGWLAGLLRAIWAITWKDLRVWVRQPANIAATVVPSLAFLLVQALGAAAVGQSPVALVVQDNGARGQQIAHSIERSNLFRLHVVSASQAQTQLKGLDVVAIITIPAGFTARVNAHQPAAVNVEVNNLNLDFTNDIRRAVPDTITQYYQAQGDASPIKITVHEHDLRSRDVQLFEYAVLPTILLLVMIGGLVSGGLAAAREWETHTVKELLLSPTGSGALITGKVLAGFLTTFALGALTLGLGALLGWTQPQGVYWLVALLVIALAALFSAGLGVAIGAAMQRIQPVIVIAINAAIYLFFLAGGTGVLAFEPGWLQNIAAVIPLTYGDHALEMAIFYNSADLLGRDLVVLAVSAAVAIGLGVFSMRRGIAS